MSRTAAELDLGERRGPVLIFGGPYSNLQASQEMLAIAKTHNIPAGNLICTGDVVAYCAEPEATVALMRQAGVISVMGNCEESFGFGQDDCGCGFAPGTACDVASKTWYAHASAVLSEASRAWMRSCPRSLRFSLNGHSFRVIHGALDEISRFIFASDAAAIKWRQLNQIGEDVIVAGHCGLPFVEPLGERLWLNPGVIGVPANDGTTRVWYGLLQCVGNDIKIELKSFSYDHNLAARRMRATGLPPGYATALTTGLWPAMDVLPKAEIARAGQTISETSQIYRRERPLIAAS
jgi:predicted phosphodiesterase